MSCSLLTRTLFKPNLLILQLKLFTSAVNENILGSNSEFLPKPQSDTKLLKVAIIGMPNAGKSTFINSLMDRKVCATSQKVHTTREKAQAIFTVDDTQVIFIDTPGLVNDREQKKFNLTTKFTTDVKKVASRADIIGVIHDVINPHTKDRLDIKIINILEDQKKIPSFLVLNKVDGLKSKRKLLDITRNLTDNAIRGKPIFPTGSKQLVKKGDKQHRCWPYFSDIFMVSALTGDGFEDMKNYLLSKAKPRKWMYPENIWTDQKMESVILNTVKAALLNFLPHEMPYKLVPAIEYFNIDENGKITTVVIVKCPTPRISKIFVGFSEGRLRNITENVQQDLQNCFHNYVKIKIVPFPPAETSE